MKTNYRQQLATLKDNLLTGIESIRRGLKEPIVFLTDEQIEEWEFEKCLDARNDRTGGTYEIHLISVSKEEIKVIRTQDGIIETIGVNDLASIDDILSLYEMLNIEVNSAF